MLLAEHHCLVPWANFTPDGTLTYPGARWEWVWEPTPVGPHGLDGGGRWPGDAAGVPVYYIEQGSRWEASNVLHRHVPWA
eukprot:gene29051-57212_t